MDACRQGWVAVRLDHRGRFGEAVLHRELESVVAQAGEALVAVDIPLGLTRQEWRECDRIAAGRVGRRSSSVFRIPPRPVVETADYAAANALCRELTGSGLNFQAHGLFAKIREADRIRGAGAGRLYEVHPELSFRTMAGAPLSAAKKNWNGQAERRRLLANEGIVLPDDLGEAGRVPADDVLDAAAAAWSAHRIAAGRSSCLPEHTQLDDRGEAIAIHC